MGVRVRRALIRLAAGSWVVVMAMEAVLAEGGTSSRPASAVGASRPSSHVSERDEALIRKLLGEATGRDRAPAIERAIEGMHGSRVMLSRQFDPGSQTQKIQRKILADLDEAIAEAIRSTKGKPGSSQATTSPADKPRRSGTRPTGDRTASASGPSEQKGDEPLSDGQTTRGRAMSTTVPSGRLRELRRGWGWLPSRDREEVVQGFGQDSLPKYREWIERYYRALAEPRKD